MTTASTARPVAQPGQPPMVLVPGGSGFHGISRAEAIELSRSYPGYGPERYEPEMPQRTVSVSAFAIDVFPVTSGAYRQAVEAGIVPAPILWEHPDWSAPDHPVVGVEWYEASAYAAWRGCRLPSEEQWEWAASWDPRTRTKRRYPWGDDWSADRCLNAELLLGQSIKSRDEWIERFWNGGAGARLGTLERVGLRDDASPFGVRMMSGHVWEWTRDRYRRADTVGGDVNEAPCDAIAVRGGSWVDDWNSCRSTYRTWSRPDAWRFGPTDIGFRCVREDPDQSARRSTEQPATSTTFDDVDRPDGS